MIIDISLYNHLTQVGGYRPETVDNESLVIKLMLLNGVLSASFNFIHFWKANAKVRFQTFGCKFFKNVPNGIVISRPIFHDETSILS